jgi:6-phosphogluconolactonase
VAFLVTGAAKAKKVQAVIEDKEKAQEKYPAAKVQPTSGNLIWFLDSKAAKLLEKK